MYFFYLGQLKSNECNNFIFGENEKNGLYAKSIKA